MLMAMAPASVLANEYLDNYKGTAFKVHTLSADAPCKMEAEDFDNGGYDVAWHFKKNSNGTDITNVYRPDIVNARINKMGGTNNYLIGNVSNGDWVYYTIDVKDAGEYKLVCHMSSGEGNTSMLSFEVDGEAVAEIIKAPGLGWNNYVDVTNKGFMLTKGRHIVRWIPTNAMNMDYYTWERTGDYVAPLPPEDVTGVRQYEYKGNPMFTELKSETYNSTRRSPFYTADPSARVWNIDGKDVLYLYPSHDLEPQLTCQHMDRYHVFSTEDMVHWTDHGEILNAEQSDKAMGFEGIDNSPLMWAPDCNYNKKDGKYYFIYPHQVWKKGTTDFTDNANKAWYMFLATSDNPAGPFTVKGYIDGVHLTGSKDELLTPDAEGRAYLDGIPENNIDPCLFVDDDGKAYVFTSGYGHCYMTKLQDDDWTKADGKTVMLPDAGFGNFHEGPWVFKKDGRYYLMHADSNPNYNRMQYSVADNINGPWTPKGVFMNPLGDDTTHGSIVNYKDKWYTFYHTCDFSGNGALRSVCYEEQTFDENGNLNLLQNFGSAHGGTAKTFDGVNSVVFTPADYNDGKGGNAYYKRDRIAPSREASATQLDNFEFLRFAVNVEKKGRYQLTLRAANLEAGSKVGVAYDGTFKTSRAESNKEGMYLPSKTDLGEMQKLVVYPVNLEAGEHYFEVRCTKGSINFESLTVGAGQTVIPGKVEAEDFDAAPDSYNFKRAADKGKNSYRDDVLSSIGNHGTSWHLGDTSNGDYWTYSIKAEESASYKMTVNLSSDNKESTKAKFAVFVDDFDTPVYTSEPFRSEAESNVWNTYFTVDVPGIQISKGDHKFRFKVVNAPMNIDSFTFTKDGAYTALQDVTAQVDTRTADVYTIDGRKVRTVADKASALGTLDHGMYIVGGKKVIK